MSIIIYNFRVNKIKFVTIIVRCKQAWGQARVLGGCNPPSFFKGGATPPDFSE